jgi:hypothetical protein
MVLLYCVDILLSVASFLNIVVIIRMNRRINDLESALIIKNWIDKYKTEIEE